MSDHTADAAVPVSFGERLAGSQAFSSLFREGMTLVEETAAYLDGPGRRESKKLQRSAALTYATESMRLTTRLMQIASWLLLHRAVKEGEMSLAQANKEKTKVKLSVPDSADEADHAGVAGTVARTHRNLPADQRPRTPARHEHLCAGANAGRVAAAE